MSADRPSVISVSKDSLPQDLAEPANNKHIATRQILIGKGLLGAQVGNIKTPCSLPVNFLEECG
jgi:hypothetical protein